MRVGLICPYSLSVPGGVQMQVLGMARELRRRGHEARVLGPCDGPPPAPYVTPLGNSLPTAANGSIAPIAPDPAAVLRTMRAISDGDFDVLHVHEPLAPGPTITAVVTRPRPIVGTFHAAGTSASYRILGPSLTRLARRIDRRVVVSKDALALAQSHLGGEYEMLFNGIEVAQIRSTPMFPRAASGRPVVFFCGRHEERKGLRVLIDAFDQLALDAELWIASDGPDTDVLMRRTAGDDRFRWLGRIDDDEKYGRLRTADVFCAPSLGGESFGIVLLEGMAADTTVVASALDGYQNVATDEVDALLPPPGDAAALARSIERALTDRDLSDRLRDAGTERAGEFAMSTLVDRYLELYEQVLCEQVSARR